MWTRTLVGCTCLAPCSPKSATSAPTRCIQSPLGRRTSQSSYRITCHRSILLWGKADYPMVRVFAAALTAVYLRLGDWVIMAGCTNSTKLAVLADDFVTCINRYRRLRYVNRGRWNARGVQYHRCSRLIAGRTVVPVRFSQTSSSLNLPGACVALTRC